jgi:hypothetical protein
VQLLFPTSKAAMERRQESIKLGILEVRGHTGVRY